jgi:hypothetical protein
MIIRKATCLMSRQGQNVGNAHIAYLTARQTLWVDIFSTNILCLTAQPDGTIRETGLIADSHKK